MPFPFDEHRIGSNQRNLYGQYRQRWSSVRRCAKGGCSSVTRANGWTWVELPIRSADWWLEHPKEDTVTIHEMQFWRQGTWIGTLNWYITINGQAVYPNSGYETGGVGSWFSLQWQWLNIRPGDELKVWFNSSDPTDGIINNASATFYANAIIRDETL